MTSDAVARIEGAILPLRGDAPFVVAIDGRSGAGKSTVARALAARLGATVIEGDDFYAGGVALRTDPPRDRARDCIDWRRLRAAIEALRRGEDATYHAFDWDRFDGALRPEATTLAPAPVVIVEGVYSGRPELADVVDLRVFLGVDEEDRVRRLVAREGAIGEWEQAWHEAELVYFAHVAPPFDLVLGPPAPAP